MKSFAYDIANYLDSNSALFSFGSGSKNLKVGELVRGERGVFIIASGVEGADHYLPFQYQTLEFWAVNESSEEGQEWLLAIYNLFHQAHHYNTNSYTIFFSHATTPIMDLDRDGEGRKLLKIGVRFICTNIIS